MSEHLQRLEGILPEYVCGIVWVLAIGTLVALSTTPAEAAVSAAYLAKVIQPLHFPEITIGFLLAVFGVLLPYATAVIFGPFSTFISDMIYRRWYRGKPGSTQLPASYAHVVCERIERAFGVPEPPVHSGRFLAGFLRHYQTPAWPPLAGDFQILNIQLRSVLPASVLVGALL